VEQFESVKAALLWMIEQCIGADFTAETRDAWIAAYDLIAGITLSAFD
jgi:hemoglobin-like flavoprotein